MWLEKTVAPPTRLPHAPCRVLSTTGEGKGEGTMLLGYHGAATKDP